MNEKRRACTWRRSGDVEIGTELGEKFRGSKLARVKHILEPPLRGKRVPCGGASAGLLTAPVRRGPQQPFKCSAQFC